MQKEKTSCKTLTQNVNIRTDTRTDRRTDRKTKTIYTSTYFICWGYNNVVSYRIVKTLIIKIPVNCIVLTRTVNILTTNKFVKLTMLSTTRPGVSKLQIKHLFQLKILIGIFLISP